MITAILLILMLDSVCLNLAHEYTMQGGYEESEAILSTLQHKHAGEANYEFHRLVNNFALNRAGEAKIALANLSWERDLLPMRYQVLTNFIEADIQTWKKDDISDIARDMKVTQNRLSAYKGGKQTQRIQDSIVNRLNKLIDEAENPNSNSGNKNSDNKERKQSQGKGQARPNSPLKDSSLANQTGPSKVDKKKFRELAENWGKLPDKDRAKAMLDITREMPVKHRELIENYFRNLSRSESPKD